MSSSAIILLVRLDEPLRNRANGSDSHGHWSRRSGPARELRERVYVIAKTSRIRAAYVGWTKHADRLLPVLSPASWLSQEITVAITRVSPRPLDGHDGLPHACKPIVDGLADALGLKSDRTSRVSWVYAQRRGGAREHGVEIEIVPREVCAACGQVVSKALAGQASARGSKR